MKTLYLVRHAKSSWGDPSLNDFDRPLNKRGLKDAPLMADHFSKNHARPDQILSSPAKRAMMTAEIFAGKLGYPGNSILKNEFVYDAIPDDLLHVLHDTDNRIEKLMVFGHNPGIPEFIYYLSNNHMHKVPTCSICALALNIEKWKQAEFSCGKILFFESPKIFKL